RDWSSDVCSSDLFASPYRLKQRSAAAPAAGPGVPSGAVQAGTGATATAKGATPALDIDGIETLDFKTHMQDYEIELLREAMKRCQFNQRKAAEFLQMSYHQLRGYLRKYDLLG